jgi:nitroreductase
LGSTKGEAVETWDTIRARRNVRAYTDAPIPSDALDRILEAAWRAPSASNRQMWDFVVVTERDELVKLAEVWQGAGHVAGSAATIALIAPDPDSDRTRDLIQYDLGQVTMQIMLAAADLGIGSGHSAVGDQDAARALLGVPDGHFTAWLIALGYPADRPLAPIVHPNRRPIEEVVHRGTF